MPLQVIDKQNKIICDAGSTPQALLVTSQSHVFELHELCATIADCIATKNIPSFGSCTHTPAPPSSSGGPCVPNPSSAPWSPGSSTTTYDGFKALRKTDTLTCATGGTISVQEPGQQELDVVD